MGADYPASGFDPLVDRARAGQAGLGALQEDQMRHVLHYAVIAAFSALPAAYATDAPVRYAGVNIAGGDFAVEHLPGEYGRDYVYPDPQTIAYFAAKGMNIIRVPVFWERLQHKLGSELDGNDMQRLDAVIADAGSKGMKVILDVHNYATYYGTVIGEDGVPPSALGDLWGKLATRYKNNDTVVFGLMNEPHDLPTETWLEAANDAIAAIRRAGANNLILVPGNGWSSARSWLGGYYGTPNGDVMLNVKDPADNYVYEVHQYFNSDFTGTSADCQSADIGIDTLTPVTDWAKEHGKRIFLGEIGVGSGKTCLDALDRSMRLMTDNSDVWLGWTYWAAGAWWPQDYFTSVQPLGGKDRPQMAVLQKYTRAKEAMR
jgi:endoglucanase